MASKDLTEELFIHLNPASNKKNPRRAGIDNRKAPPRNEDLMSIYRQTCLLDKSKKRPSIREACKCRFLHNGKG